MRTRLYFKLLPLVCFFLAMPLWAGNSKDGDDEEIIIRVGTPVPTGSPHMPVYNPFYAEHVGNTVVLGSLSDVGIVQVTLTSTAGDNYSSFFDTDDGSIVIPICGQPGHHTLLITTLSGFCFIGEFVIL